MEDFLRILLQSLVTTAWVVVLGRVLMSYLKCLVAFLVVIIVGALHDIVSRVPPEQAGRSEVWLSSLGEATLIIQIADSLSGEVIYRAIDRRAAESVGGQMVRGNSAQTWGEVRRWARRWATRLREGLDSIHE